MNGRQAPFPRIPLRCGAGLLLWALAALPAQSVDDPLPQIQAVDSRLDRDFGHVMGGTLRQTIRVETDAGYVLEEGMLPQTGSAVNDWLEVREARWQGERHGDRQTYRIDLTYQMFKGVRGAETVAIPPVPLRFHSGGTFVEAEAPAQAYTLNPLIPASVPDEAVVIRGLRPPPPVEDSGHGIRLALLLAASGAALLFATWCLGLPPFGNRRARPFEEALRELRKLRRQPATPDTYRHALRRFHAALNAYARRTVLQGHLPALLRDHPELAALREELEAFFAQSHRLFFTPSGTEFPAGYSLSRLENLCRQCRAIERGHA